MTSPSILAIDVGLTNVKAVIFGPTGELVARASVPYPTHRPGPDAAEQHPSQWWSAVARAVRRLPDEARRRVVSIGVTAHMHALVCLGRDGAPIGPALVLGDRRAASDAREIADELGPGEIYAATGAELDASMPAAKARYLRRRDPGAWASVTHLLACKDYLRYRLTGEIATEPIDACATSLYDIRSGCWSKRLLETVGATEAMMPPLRSPWAVAGPLLAAPAEALGLRRRTPVAVGAGDDVIVVGLGVLDPGVGLEHIGTTGSIMAVLDHPVLDPDRALELYPHVLPDRWVVGGSHTTAGAALDWAAHLLGYDSVSAALASLDTPGTEELEFLPTLAGERFPARVPAARGAWAGMPLGVTREDLMQAAFVGVAAALGGILERIDGLAGRQSAMRVSTAEDERWCAMRAEIYGRRLEVSATTEPTALGLACLAAVAGGLFSDVRSAVAAMTRVERYVEPTGPGTPHVANLERVLQAAWVEAETARGAGATRGARERAAVTASRHSRGAATAGVE
jgi:xylulokinase